MDSSCADDVCSHLCFCSSLAVISFYFSAPLGLTLVGTSMASPLSVLSAHQPQLGLTLTSQPQLGLTLAPTGLMSQGLTSAQGPQIGLALASSGLSPGQTVLLDTSVPPPGVTHFTTTTSQQPTIALGEYLLSIFTTSFNQSNN